jgi:hypothetical protein
MVVNNFIKAKLGKTIGILAGSPVNLTYVKDKILYFYLPEIIV